MSLTKATYSMITGAPVNILDYGADPSGANDSSAAIQAAINTGNTVYFPDGNFRIESPININSATRKIYGNGNKTVILPYLSAGEACFDLTAQAVKFQLEGFYFDLPSGEESNIIAIKFSSATFANRGNTIRDIWINGLQKGLLITAEVYARLSVENWNHHYLSANTAGAISIDANNVANTTFLSNIDIIGGFQYGIRHSGTVFSIRNFNIAGSGLFVMDTAIYCTGASGTIQDGWIEQLTNPGAPAEQPAIYLDTTRGVSVKNVFVANGSIYLKDGKGNIIETCQYGNANAGIRTVGFPDYTIIAGNQLIAGDYFLANYALNPRGRFNVVGYNGYKPKRGYLAQAASLMTSAPTRTNPSFVTLTADTSDYLLGSQSQLVTTTATFQGVQFAFTGLLASSLYTFTAFIKSTSSSDVVRASATIGSYSSGYPNSNTSNQTDWTKISLPVNSNGSGNITIDVKNDIVGSFKIDSAQLWLGYRLDDPEQTLP